MTPQKQLFLHNPPETYGDCHRTCIACMLDIHPSEVPHFAATHWDDTIAWKSAEKEYLASKGMSVITIPFQGDDLKLVLNSIGYYNPGAYYLLTGISRNETAHVVICRDGEIVWDPSINDSGIISPCDGYYWIDFFVPLVMMRKSKWPVSLS